ncbi:MAG TPA: hypothetical protein VIH99_03295 [Bdellovibrionota bacterium]|jgi:hypothetical protein
MPATHSHFSSAISQAASRGLNIFASCPVTELPPDVHAGLCAALDLGAYASFGLFAHGGRTLWENINQPALEENHPVDTHSRSCTEEFLRQLHADKDMLFLYPSDTFLIPLQRLGRFLNVSHPSPLGIDINSDFGPWFAYRTAFLTKIAIPSVRLSPLASPCESCNGKPCLTACPVGATGTPFAMSRCATYRLGEGSHCLDRCLARIACPYQEQHRYTDEQIRYHMLRPNHLKRLMDYKS